ncbi:hypothetical protein ABOM_002110 [Aspergillus bombycis]|uniref:Uncharacterized protein n=1 Tax=Aspergillus bombycis TaxID=109264 RepID=A0A1F8A9A8_9EURO|nr:hypothetical protein ABOM_002110 [Aspergillus bombycis]OGM48263.1 hypothetical protein ABOM_002110 [Aspergillus bombycis]
MKLNPRAATVHDVDNHDNPILHSRRSAMRVKKEASPSAPRKNTLNHAIYPRVTIGESIISGPIEHMVKALGTHRSNPLTIFTRGRNESREWNEISGCQFRKVFFTDETEILKPDAVYERQQSVRLTAFIPKKDETHPDPRIYVEQRVYRGGQEQIVLHELGFGGRIQVGVEYVFAGCGDEHVNWGKRDLLLQVQSLDQDVFDSYMHQAKYYGYDHTYCIYVNRHMVSNGVNHRLPILDQSRRSPCNICFDPDDLQALLKAKGVMPSNSEVPSTTEIELLKLRLRGLGDCTEDGMASGDLHIRIIYKP